MGQRKILMASHHCWTSPIQVGSHHLAREFVRLGYEVAFVSDPISPLHWLGGASDSLKKRLALYRSGGARDLGGKLWAYVPGALLTPANKPLLKSDWVAQYWNRMTWPGLLTQVIRNGFGRVDLLYVESVYQAFWLDALSYRHSIYRLADHPEGHLKMKNTATRALVRKVAAGVSAVAYTADNLRDFALSLGAGETFHLPNGVQFRHFAENQDAPPPEYDSLPGPKIVYVGSMEDWFDFKLVIESARRYPKFSFILIGTGQRAREKVQSVPNIHFLGPREYERIPAYFRHADAGIIPNNVWDRSSLVHFMNPLKLYQYLACGLPVVASRTRELTALKSPALLAGDRAAFIRLLPKALRQGKSAASVRYARKNDWSIAARRILRQFHG